MTVAYKNPIMELEKRQSELHDGTYCLSENTQQFLKAFEFARDAEDIARESYLNLFPDADLSTLAQKSNDFVNEIFKLMNGCLEKNLYKKKFTVIKDKKVMASIDIKDEVISLPDYVKILKSAAETALNFEKV